MSAYAVAKETSDLDDPTKSCIYIAPGDELEEVALSGPYSPHDWRDLPDGYELRMQAYKEAWTQCLRHMQSIIQALHAPVAKEVVAQVKSAYMDTLPGLPYAELPAMLVFGGSSGLYSDIIQQLEVSVEVEDDCAADEAKSDITASDGAIMIHLYPGDFPNLTTAMKSIVTGFIDQSTDSGQNGMKRRPAASLATYDISVLDAWYRSLDKKPSLTIFLHDFEQFEPAVVQDVLHIPELPLVYILAMSSPPSPSFLHTTYPRSTLALLSIHKFSAPLNVELIDELVEKTFCDPNFEPAVMLGPGSLGFLADFVSRHTASVDATLTIIQLALMKHFTEPLTIFIESSTLGLRNERLAGQKLDQPESQPFRDVLTSRLARSTSNPDDVDEDAISLLRSVNAARDGFYRKLRTMRIGLSVMSIVRQAIETERENESSMLDTLIAALRGRANRDVRQLATALSKCNAQQLQIVLQKLQALYDGLQDSDARDAEMDAHVRVSGALTELADTDNASVDAEKSRDPLVARLAKDLGEWLFGYLEKHLIRLDDGPLWDIWYTGSAPFPAELINPAPRPALVSALAHPNEHAAAYARLLRMYIPQDKAETGSADQDVREDEGEDEDGLPDTALLFRRYAEAGRLVNVYDWFQSFAGALDGRRRRERRAAVTSSGNAHTHGVSGAVSNGKGKGRARAHIPMEVDEADEDAGRSEEEESELGEDEDEEAAEAWRIEVRVRFIRALHELDYLGVVKPTGRKADHVVRTLYDVVY
ncbi:hypothetical protein POSPLADRAFT_1075993 [Postia placenta MAD-698-R-SB12]|uniref:Uncharacterized protein n=1 Tax=Postia placenta MAD-698-R-SB12 TaxID=670580 RepID=A0A1X6MQ84_9APHY|nr:hypothetical protein POSPLADRAFT_1075993 [Postia placenta MAD-698-R-SB12]OSX58283.1 hypothetical protein POSPLADRAFT_1075993 [Postia placenta MAD-698-R-SB12]